MNTTPTNTINEDTVEESNWNSVHLLKNELTDFHCVLAVVAFESITDDVSTTKIREIISLVVLGNEFQ